LIVVLRKSIAISSLLLSDCESNVRLTPKSVSFTPGIAFLQCLRCWRVVIASGETIQ
jgi:hypothetical protein